MARDLDALDRRIIGALQVDGRASWRRIAEVLGESFSTVTRRGSALLESGAVRVAALWINEATTLFEVTAHPRQLDAVARVLAARPRSTFVYAVAAPSRIVVEEYAGPDELGSAVLDEIPKVEGVTGVTATPVLDYYRTVDEWMPSLITDEEAAELRLDVPGAQETAYGSGRASTIDMISTADRRIRELLRADGRMSVADISADLGISASAARSRVNRLLESNLRVRAVVEPRDLGLPIEALVQIQLPPADVAGSARAVAALPEVRYAVVTMGERMLLVDIAVGGIGALREFLTVSSWTPHATSVSSSLVMRAYKRGGVPWGV